MKYHVKMFSLHVKVSDYSNTLVLQLSLLKFRIKHKHCRMLLWDSIVKHYGTVLSMCNILLECKMVYIKSDPSKIRCFT